jgi:hypothetical protein
MTSVWTKASLGIPCVILAVQHPAMAIGIEGKRLGRNCQGPVAMVVYPLLEIRSGEY